jgi:hypothetical protein
LDSSAGGFDARYFWVGAGGLVGLEVPAECGRNAAVRLSTVPTLAAKRVLQVGKPADARARPNIGKNCWFGNTLAAQKRRSKNFGTFDARAVSVRQDAGLEVDGCCIA